MALITSQARKALLGPGIHEIRKAEGPLSIVWFLSGPIKGKGGRPFTCAVPITKGKLQDKYFLGLLCQLEVRIWSPLKFTATLLGGKGSEGLFKLNVRDLELRIKELVGDALEKAMPFCSSGDVESPTFPDFLEHTINLALASIGLRACSFRVLAYTLKGPYENVNRLYLELGKSFPSLTDQEGREKKLLEKIELLKSKPWLLSRPERGPESWLSSWRSFWVELIKDWMWVNRRFCVEIDELSSLEPFSRMMREHLEDVFRALRAELREEGGRVILEDVLEGLCSCLPKWALQNGLYELDVSSLERLLGLSPFEAKVLLKRLVASGCCEWSREGSSVVFRP